jgi:DNA-binding response OmpR family regulator
VIAVSTSDSWQDRKTMSELGAAAYFRKPSAYAEFMKLGDMIKAVLG